MDYTNELTDLYKEQYNSYVKTMTFRAGTVWDAEEIVQEAFYRAYKYLHTYEGTGIKNWFSTVIRNAFRQHMNNHNGFSNTNEEFEEAYIEPIPCSMIQTEILKEIKEAINKESEPAATILTYHFHHEMTPAEIAELTGSGIWAIYKTIARFKDKLKLRYE